MSYINDLNSSLQQLGFFDFLLPWLFVFAVVYGLLLKANIFGDVNKKVSGIIALIFAFFVAPYAGTQLSTLFSTLGTTMIIILTGIIGFIIFATALDVQDLYKNKKLTLGLIAIVAIAVFLMSAENSIRGFDLGNDFIFTLVFLGILGVGVWVVINDNGGSGK